ncbi:MAG: GAF domain-containing protein, partial [Anaerolineae bacterium]|nr:GAF domain-containing protein [Anaerolineae bacterium]
YREMQRRTHEAEGLRAVTEIASQSGPLQPIIEQIIIAIANLLESQVVALTLVDEDTGELVLEPDTVWGATLDRPYKIDAYAAGFEESVLVSRRPFLSNSLRDDRRVLLQYRALVSELNLHNAIQVPLVIRDRSIGELTVANRAPGVLYTGSDVQLLMAIATQVAAMIDRQRLYQATDQGLRARLQELDALSRVSHELSQTIELGRILDVIRQEALRSTPASAVTVVLLARFEDEEGVEHIEVDQRFGETKAFTGLAPIEQAAIDRNDTVLLPDYAESDLAAAPGKTRSALVVPVMFGDRAVGLIHLYSSEPGAFDQRVMDFVMALTNQAAIAIGNARRYQEQLEANQQLRVRAERMGRIFELGEKFRQGASLPDMLEEVAHSVQETVGFNVVLISLADTRTGVLRRTAQAGLPLAVFEEMQRTTPSLDQARSLMQDRYRISHSYFLPAEGSADLIAELPIYQVLQERMGPGARAWAPEDLLIIPLWGARDHLLGIMTVDEPRSGRRPDLATVEALEIFASQAAFSIENYRLVERIQQEAELTRRERDRLAQLHLVASEIQRAADVPSRLQVVADGIHQAGWGKVVITLRDEHLEPTALIYAGFTPEEAESMADDVVPGKVWRQWLNDLAFHELKLGAGYYLRYDRPWVREHVLNGENPDPLSVPDDAWHPQDLIYMPLVGQDQRRIIGVIAMGEPVDGRVPTEAALQPFELFASQAAAAIETTRLYLETVRAAEQEQRLNEMMEVVSSALSPEAVIEAIGRGLQQMVPFTRMSVALFDEQSGRLDLLRADIAPGGSVRVMRDAPLDPDSTAMGTAYRAGASRLYALHRESQARKQYADLQSWYDSGERSSLVVPMIAGGQVIGALHLGSELENAYGFQENLELIQRL